MDKYENKYDLKIFNTLILLIAIALAILYIIPLGIDPDSYWFIIKRRVLEAVAMLVVGTAIAVSSVLFQTITNNRILTPSIIGFDSLYLMICSIVVLFFHKLLVPNLVNIHIFFFLTVALMIIFSELLYKFLFIIKENTVYYVLLSGVVFSLLFRSIYTFFISIMDVSQYDALQRKLYASFDLIQYDLLAISIVIVLLAFNFVCNMIPDLNVYLIGKDNAKILGVDTDKVQIHCMRIISILVSVSTVLVGPITFLGLFAVNIMYILYKTRDHGMFLLGTTFISWIILFLGAILVERVFEFDTNLTVIINGIGGIYFIYLLLKGRIK